MALLQFLPRFRELDRQLRAFEERESWSNTDVQAYQLERLNQIWSHARVHVEHYQTLAGQLPERFRTLSEYSETMPVLSKQIVRDQPQRFLASDALPCRWQRTGGSTGTPMGIYWEHESHREILRAKYRCEQAHGISVFDRKIFLWGHSGSFAPGLKGRVQRLIRPSQDWLRNRKRISAYDLSAHRLTSQLKKIQAFQPSSVYGYSSAVCLLADAAAEAGVEVPTLNVAIMTAEPVDQAMCQRVQDKLHCTAVVEYGAVECGLMAYRMPDGTFRTRDDIVLMETLPNSLGSQDIVISVLNNASFPLLRYRIEDTTSKTRVTPEQGFGILQDVQGRSNDFLIGKKGRKLHSMAVKHALEHWPMIRRFTAHQGVDGELLLTIESADSVSPQLLNSLERSLEEMIEGFPVSIKTVGAIPGSLAGKHRWVVSEMASEQVEAG